MWITTVEHHSFTAAEAWRIERLRPNSRSASPASGPHACVGDLVTVREAFGDPTDPRLAALPYIGLDSVTPVTGELSPLSSAALLGICSRSRVFHRGDILYGRLRAYLNKVTLIGEEFERGLCSGEFYVLSPKPELIAAELLHWFLTDKDMVEYVSVRLAGATHPRLALEDLLAYQVLVPSVQKQTEAVAVLRSAHMRLRELRSELAEHSGTVADAVRTIIT